MWLILSLKKVEVLHLNELESPLPKDVLSHIGSMALEDILRLCYLPLEKFKQTLFVSSLEMVQTFRQQREQCQTKRSLELNLNDISIKLVDEFINICF